MKKVLKKIVIAIITLEARIVLLKYKPKIVAVTGTVGKTSTKDAIFCVLKDSFYVRKSEKSYNSQIGVPLTILGLPNAWNSASKWLRNIIDGLLIILLPNHYPKWLVLEMGVDRPGDMKKLARIVRPDIVVLTKFSKVPVHIEYFSSAEEVINEKLNLVRYIKPGGVVVFNGDDEDIKNAVQKVNITNFSYGFGDGLAVSGSNYSIRYEKKGRKNIPSGITFKIDYGAVSLPVVIGGALGLQHAYPVLAAISVGVINNLNLVEMIESLSFHRTPLGRMKILGGINGSILIDDSYNSSPIAVEAAILGLKVTKWSGKKILVLGDMLELGIYSSDEHQKVGQLASQNGDLLIVVGLRAQKIADGASYAGMEEKNIIRFVNSKEAGEFLEEKVTSKDLILIKGSQGMRMEKIVFKLLENKAEVEFLLVRQEEEWIKK